MRISFIVALVVLGATQVARAQDEAPAEGAVQVGDEAGEETAEGEPDDGDAVEEAGAVEDADAVEEAGGVDDAGAVEAGDAALSAEAAPPAEVVIDFSVTSEPEGARVIVDGRVVGVTPLDTQLAIPADVTSLRITVEADGHQPRTREVTPMGRAVVMDAALTPLPRSSATGTDPVPPPELEGLRPQHVFGAGLAFFTRNSAASTSLTMMTLTLDGSFRLLGQDAQGELAMDLLARWSFAALLPSERDAEARPNNPTLSLMFGSRFGPMRIYGGPGITLPVAAAIDDSRPRRGDPHSGARGLLAHSLSGAMRGYVEPWEFLESHIGLHARVGTEARFDVGHVGAEMALGVAPGIAEHYNGVHGFFGWQLRIFGTLRAVSFFSFGGELAVVYWRDLDAPEPVFPDFGSPPPDPTYVSLEPYVRFHFGAGFLGARLLLNLTESIGFSFDPGGIWSATLEGGVALE